MKLRLAVAVCVIMFVGAGVFVHAQDAASDKPAKKGNARLTQPWNKISTLSDEQKTKIREIHAKANADKKAIDDKERADVLALLTDEQKAEAEKLMAEAKKKPAAEGTTVKEGDPSNEKKVVVEEKKVE